MRNFITGIILFCLLPLAQYSFAQQFVADTLSHSEQIELVAAYRNSSFGNFLLADSCSMQDDSLSASSYLLKVDPYLLLFEKVTPQTIDSYLIKHFKVTAKSRAKYAQVFNKAFAEKKSQAYLDFRKMETEDQDIRNAFDKCVDSACFGILSKKMRRSDSIHFSYLRKYVKKSGWPELRNGSQFASVLAIHDHAHLFEYIPPFKKAITGGQASLNDLGLMLYWYSINNDSDYLEKAINAHKYTRFNVNALLEDRMPSCLPDIEYAVERHAPARIYLVCECRTFEMFDGLMNREFSRGDQGAFTKLMVDLAMFNRFPNRLQKFAAESGLWSTEWRKADIPEPRLSLYVTYYRDDTSTLKFNKLLKDQNFITHAINFDVNKASIKKESFAFLRQLTKWLKDNFTVRLEIDGHTDGDGDLATNIRLSHDRAAEVKRYLIAAGIAPSRLSVQGYGSAKPIAPNTTTAGKAENRRVEFLRL